jgi:outer membrane receptor protein involved in Fe transport
MKKSARTHRKERGHHFRMTVIGTVIAAAWQTSPSVLAQTSETERTLPTVEVVGTTPLPGVGLPREQIPANVQTLRGAPVEDPRSATLPDVLNRYLGSVIVNEIQGNPFQPDVNYRGFTASPLLGTPQGLSIYMDGVRFNQPFGDVVSWDLIPRSAIASINLMPGSNPLFGLNTLGGALSIQTKDGRHNPGTDVQALFGSYGRQAFEFEHGGYNDKGLNWFVTGNGFKEDGWREDSPSRVGQLFGKLGWMDARTDLSLTVALADTKLTGNGLQEQRLLEQDYHSVYTKPDETKNRSAFLNLAANHSINENFQLSGNAYYRKIKTSTFNGDINEDSLDQSVYQPTAAEQTALTAAGYSGFPSSGANASNTPFPFWRCIGNVLLSDEPAEKCNGLLNRSETSQENYGLTGQFTVFGNLGEHKNQFTAGAGYDASRVNFLQSAQFGYINPDHSITPVNFFADGAEIDDAGNPIDARVSLDGRTHTWSLYATDTVSIRDVLHVTLSGRYNQTTVHNRDQINPGGGSGSLDGDHNFSRLNPAVGATLVVNPALNVYAGYNEGSRTPTAIELGCADPANPCKLPNAMAGDPPLNQVVTKTLEAGVRGTIGHKTHWNAGVFRADNIDDILFVADNAAGFGFFRNFGKTRRQGIELGLDSQIERMTLSANYTYLNATFQSGEVLNSPANSSSDANGNIAIQPGDHLPLIPTHTFKARADWQATPAWLVGLGMLVVSSSNARGNENGQHQADGSFFVGAGKSPGYAIFDLSTKYRSTPRLSFFAQINNLFDRKYATASQLGVTGFTANGNFIARPFSAIGDNSTLVGSTFLAPGAPRTAWAGMRYEFGK